ncbi:MAG: CCA tRNA nucleotidyltransferase [Bacteroidia bacterium]|nr:CCA tRNA nucleotidyltransferase [Bacteroidia bacterium]MDW8346571.1 HD domain-containing protein [Bacteroidia bacterium]
MFDHDIFGVIKNSAKELGQPVYVVGGYVRDSFLKRENKDIDFVTVGSGIKLAQKVAQKLNVNANIYKNFGTAMLKYDGLEMEFVGARKESYRKDSRKPIVEDGTLEDDLSRRDFTINAMAIDLETHQLIDFFEGKKHLEQKILKTPTDAHITFSDDPLRMMRAARFATQLNFTIDPSVLDAMKANAHRIEIVSMDRIIVEFNKILETSKPSIGIRYLYDTGILNYIFPELVRLKGVEKVNGIAHKDNFYHTLQVLDNVAKTTKNFWLRWVALLHDIAKPETKKFIEGQGWTFHGHEELGARKVPKIFRRLKLPLDERMEYVQKLVRLHARPIALVEENVTDSAVRRLLFEAGNDIDDLITFCKADITTRDKNKLSQYLKNFEYVERRLQEVEQADRLRNWQPPISGEIIMQTFNLKPSPQIGIIKNAIREAILEGQIKNDYQEAYNFMIEFAKKELNLSPI